MAGVEKTLAEGILDVLPNVDVFLEDLAVARLKADKELFFAAQKRMNLRGFEVGSLLKTDKP